MSERSDPTMLSLPSAQFQLMYGLLYPAFLGTVLVTAAQYLSSPQFGIDEFAPSRYAVAVLLVSFFAVSFYNASRATHYAWDTFLLDVLEVALMLSAFVALQMVSFSANSAPGAPKLWLAFLCLLLVLCTQHFWRKNAKPRGAQPAAVLHLVLGAMALFGLVLNRHSQVGTVVLSAFASFLLLVYGTQLTKERVRGE